MKQSSGCSIGVSCEVADANSKSYCAIDISYHIISYHIVSRKKTSCMQDFEINFPMTDSLKWKFFKFKIVFFPENYLCILKTIFRRQTIQCKSKRKLIVLSTVFNPKFFA